MYVFLDSSVFCLQFAGQDIDEQDMQTLDALLPANAAERRTLADIIFSKLDGAATIQKVDQGMFFFRLHMICLSSLIQIRMLQIQQQD